MEENNKKEKKKRKKIKRTKFMVTNDKINKSRTLRKIIYQIFTIEMIKSNRP